MKSYLISAVLIIAAISLVTSLPSVVNQTEDFLISLEIPQNNSAISGIQKYNIPPLSKNIPIPKFGARAIFVKDLVTGTVLYQKDASLSLPIASTTKIMTALVASEYFKPNSALKV